MIYNRYININNHSFLGFHVYPITCWLHVFGMFFKIDPDKLDEGPHELKYSLYISGGSGGYTYLWNNGATTPVITDLAPGNYSVVVTDSKYSLIIRLFESSAAQL